MSEGAAAAVPTAIGEEPSRREQAVSRSLDSARDRAEKRVQRFLDAARELMAEGDNGDFTVQQVVERSGQSLRSFYQYFPGKHELLLAVFEEVVAATARDLDAELADIAEPTDRLERFCVQYYDACRPTALSSPSGASAPAALVEFALQLLTSHPAEATRAFGPVVDLLDGILAEAADAGDIRVEMDRRRLAGVILQTVMFNAFATAISGAQSDDDREAAEVWRLILGGITAA